jgi:hypothetical protein
VNKFCEQLYEFFEDLVLGPADQPASKAMIEAEDRIDQWLESTGFDIAKQEARQNGPSSTISVGCFSKSVPIADTEQKLKALNTRDSQAFVVADKLGYVFASTYKTGGTNDC